MTETIGQKNELPEDKRDAFRFNEGFDDVEIVLHFLNDLPAILDEILFKNRIFKEQLTDFKIGGEIENLSLDKAFDEAKKLLKDNLELIHLAMKNNEDEKELLKLNLKKIGFTGDSLIVKGSVMNSFLRRIREFPQNLASFADKTYNKLVLETLKFINSIAGSLRIVVPGVEGIKEFKEVSEAIINGAEVDREIADIKRRKLKNGDKSFEFD